MKAPKTIRCGRYRIKIKLVKSFDNPNIMGLFSGGERTISILKKLSTSNKHLVLIHELFHLACWYHQIYPSRLRKRKDIEENIINTIDKTFYKLIKQLYGKHTSF